MRTVTDIYTERFDYNDQDVVGYLVGGDLTTVTPDRETRKAFAGDWSVIRFSDVWSMIHNGDRQPVTFWADMHTATTIYPHWEDSSRFRVVKWSANV